MEYKLTLINDMIPLLKDRGYKKNRRTWYRETEDLVVVFNVQNSAYGPEYYINLGIMIKDLQRPEEGICITNCPLQERVPIRDKSGTRLCAEKMMQILSLWEEWYGTLEGLRAKAREDRLPAHCTDQARTYLGAPERNHNA